MFFESPSLERNSFIERVLFFYESFFYTIPSLNVFSSFMIYESSPQLITWNKLYASNASPENFSPKKAIRNDLSFFNSKIDSATGVIPMEIPFRKPM